MFVRILVVVLLVLIAWTLVARGSTASGGERGYVVRPHDTLWSIAVRRYAGDPREGVWRIRERNGLAGTLIHPGQRLVLPGA